MMMRTLSILAVAMLAATAAQAASVAKSYSYFSIGGSTLEEIQSQLESRGPKIKLTGQRHPGATQMEFTTRIGYAENARGCAVVDASVNVRAKVILPKWKRNRKAEADVRLIWDTLASDIKRHEESHVVIARNYARDLEQALKGLRRAGDCKQMAVKAKALTAKYLARHDSAQDAFDRVEGINFESRLLRLLHYRLERIKDGRLKG